MDEGTLYVMVAIGLLVVVAIVAGMWRSIARGYRRGRHPDRYRRVRAQVVDVALSDSHDDDEHVTQYRVLLRFSPVEGELVVVDQTFIPTDEQKDMMLPDHWLSIVYAIDEPQDFHIEWSDGVLLPDGVTGKRAVVEERAVSTAIYSPPSLRG